MRGNLVWDICVFVPCKAGLTKEVVFHEGGLSKEVLLYSLYIISVSGITIALVNGNCNFHTMVAAECGTIIFINNIAKCPPPPINTQQSFLAACM